MNPNHALALTASARSNIKRRVSVTLNLKNTGDQRYFISENTFTLGCDLSISVAEGPSKISSRCLLPAYCPNLKEKFIEFKANESVEHTFTTDCFSHAVSGVYVILLNIHVSLCPTPQHGGCGPKILERNIAFEILDEGKSQSESAVNPAGLHPTGSEVPVLTPVASLPEPSGGGIEEKLADATSLSDISSGSVMSSNAAHTSDRHQTTAEELYHVPTMPAKTSAETPHDTFELAQYYPTALCGLAAVALAGVAYYHKTHRHDKDLHAL